MALLDRRKLTAPPSLLETFAPLAIATGDVVYRAKRRVEMFEPRTLGNAVSGRLPPGLQDRVRLLFDSKTKNLGERFRGDSASSQSAALALVTVAAEEKVAEEETATRFAEAAGSVRKIQARWGPQCEREASTVSSLRGILDGTSSSGVVRSELEEAVREREVSSSLDPLRNLSFLSMVEAQPALSFSLNFWFVACLWQSFAVVVQLLGELDGALTEGKRACDSRVRRISRVASSATISETKNALSEVQQCVLLKAALMLVC